MRPGPRFKGLEFEPLALAKASQGQHWIGLPRALEKARDVAAILLLQRAGIVFGMSLEKNEQTLSLLDEEIDTGAGRPSKETVTAAVEIACDEIVPARMREPHLCRKVACKRMILQPHFLKQPEALFGEQSTADVIEMQYRRVGREAREQDRNGVVLGPVDNLRERR